ncbi:MAG: alpha/beta hydrolase [Alphaproteobacteria bacterium]|nr:alpha/beta hydrolase [Alphaproteobacteria bacterium]
MPNPPSLEPRFLAPPGWQWGTYTRESRRIRYGFAVPENPRAIVVVLPGLSEFCEKYFETAHDLLKRNLGVFVIDWFGQGRSGRYLPNPHKRHSTGFDEDVKDLDELIRGHIKLMCPQSQLILLAHSMGGNIGLRYLIQNPTIFKAYALSAPMLGIFALARWPGMIRLRMTRLVAHLRGEAYAPGAGDWTTLMRPTPGRGFFSGDAVRDAVHNLWCLADPDLQVGGVTYKWVYEAVRSCLAIRDEDLKAITIPGIMALAGIEAFVDNRAIRRAAKILPHIRLLEFPRARHEILMEKDEIRSAFWAGFDDLLLALESAAQTPL